jgi:Rrf2 family transcriptional regulator, iron-sulfur cluster assembly transcription factor
MYLTQSSEYAFRAMACLAGLEPGAALNAQEIAGAVGAPAHFLSKVLRKLVLAGLVSSQKGHGGGFALARPASVIRFAEILEAMGVARDDHCAFGWARCNRLKPCPMHDAWADLRDRCRTWAESHHLADIRPQEVETNGLPKIPPRRTLPVVDGPPKRGRRPAT